MALTVESLVKTKPVLIVPDAHEALQRLAEADHRTLGGEVQWLIEQEQKRRDVDAEHLKRAEGEG